MTETNNHELAGQVYQTLCDYLDRSKVSYFKKDDVFQIHCVVTGEDLFIMLDFEIDEESRLIHLTSTFPFIIPEERRIEGAIAACTASNALSDGQYDYDMSTGIVNLRLNESFIDRPIGEGIFYYLINYAVTVVDMINDRFFMLSRGLMDADDILAQFSEDSEN